MNPKIANVRVSAIIHATEDPDKVISAMQRLGPEAEVRPERWRASGHYGNEIKTVHIAISNRSRAETFLSHFWRSLSLIDQKEIIDHISTYLDQSGHLHIRIDKQEAVNGIMVIGQSEPIRIETSFDLRGIPNQKALFSITQKLEELAS
jgi:RNA binding exosome subunit